MDTLRRQDLLSDPLAQFARWFTEAQEKGLALPEAMTLATVDQIGLPQARMVLLRGLSGRGFVFYTNYNSQKGEDLAARPHAALVFHWPVLDRQVRVRGTVERIPPAESDQYFRSRPRGSQIGAWASPQSQVIPDREYLERSFSEAESRFSGREVPRPAGWGGYELVPTEIEFWQGQADRLHDRLRYQLGDEEKWQIVRLAP